MHLKWALVLFFAAALLLAACEGEGFPGSGEAGVSPEPSSTAAPVDLTTSAPNIPLPAVTVTPAPAAESLRLWMPPEIAAKTERGMTTLSSQLSAYDMDHPQIALVVEQKRVLGAGGMFSYLRTGRDIAPAILPDLMAIPADVLPLMASENLIYPLDGKFDDQAIDTLFPPALSMAQVGSSLLGYPFVLTTMPHLAYNSNALSGTLPLTWERLAENDEHSYVFAADGVDGALLALQFYLDAGGTVTNEAGEPALAIEPLEAALQHIENGRETGLFIRQSGTINNTEQAWQSFLSGSANIVQTTADHFLGQNVAGLPIAYTVIPGEDRPLTPLAGGWVWVITTADPEKQDQAVALIQTVTAPDALAAWSYDSNMLPARRDAFDVWPVDDPYLGFASQLLERAEPFTISTSGKVMTALGDAVFQIVAEDSSAEQAADTAVNAVSTTGN